MMEYNAASVKFLLWHVETKETAKLLQDHSFDEIRRMVLEDNIYQQKSRERAQSEFSCIKKRLQALPEELIQKLIQFIISMSKKSSNMSGFIIQKYLIYIKLKTN